MRKPAPRFHLLLPLLLAAACESSEDNESDASADAAVSMDSSHPIDEGILDAAPPDSNAPDSTIRPPGGPPHGYFDSLAEQPNVHYALAARSNEEIWPLIWRRPEQYNADELFYDAVVDGAANFFDVGDGSSGSAWGPGRDDRNRFDPISNTTALFYWEARWSDRFLEKDDRNRIGGELETHKGFILLGDQTDDRALEIRSRFSRASAAEGVARTDIRQYGSAAGISPGGETEGGDSVGMRRDDFVVQANTWTYHWVHVDMAEGRLTYWIQDEDQALATIYDDIPIEVVPELAIVGFEFRHNSSQGGGTASPGFIWNRNLAVLTDIARSDAEDLVRLR